MRKGMTGRRAWRILLVLWQAWCLNVFLPAHTRGAMTVGEAVRGTPAATHPCCAPRRHDDDDDRKPTPEQKSRCAVCYYAMGLSVPPVADCRLRDAGFAQILPPPRPLDLISPGPDLPFDACGPPALG
jgi:hypothetical protein